MEDADVTQQQVTWKKPIGLQHGDSPGHCALTISVPTIHIELQSQLSTLPLLAVDTVIVGCVSEGNEQEYCEDESLLTLLSGVRRTTLSFTTVNNRIE